MAVSSASNRSLALSIHWNNTHVCTHAHKHTQKWLFGYQLGNGELHTESKVKSQTVLNLKQIKVKDQSVRLIGEHMSSTCLLLSLSLFPSPSLPPYSKNKESNGTMSLVKTRDLNSEHPVRVRVNHPQMAPYSLHGALLVSRASCTAYRK